jgi:hypothetical protein
MPGPVAASPFPSAAKIKDGMVTVKDFNASITHALGISHEEILMSPTRRPFTIVDKGRGNISAQRVDVGRFWRPEHR